MTLTVAFLAAAVLCGVAAGRASDPDARKLLAATRLLLGSALGSTLYSLWSSFA